MATFVLVHGAFHGSWSWKRVRRALQEQGHDVFTPALHGSRRSLTSLVATCKYRTHILDVENLIRWEELSDVVLCGHYYGGCVISGAADRMPDRIRALFYVDAFVLEAGENVAQHTSEIRYKQLLQAMNAIGEGWKVPLTPGKVFNVNVRDREWMDPQCTMQPLETLQQRIRLSGALNSVKNVTFVLATGFVEGSPFPPFYEKARANGWRTMTVPCGHDVMLDLSEELTEVLLDASQAQVSVS